MLSVVGVAANWLWESIRAIGKHVSPSARGTSVKLAEGIAPVSGSAV